MYLVVQSDTLAEVIIDRQFQLTPYPACSASFFSRNSVFLSQHFSKNSVFQPISAKIQQAERSQYQ